MEVFRIVEDQAKLSSYRATQDEEEAVQLELVIEKTKPKNLYIEWHDLIATPFRYTPPLRIARFCSEYARNIFYGSCNQKTTYYEYSYHFIYERRHLKIKTETGRRTLFGVNADLAKTYYLKTHPDCDKIMDKNDYSFSHQFMHDNPDIISIVYPSCRDPERGDNVAVLDISVLQKSINYDTAIKFFYDNTSQEIFWLDAGLHVAWNDVAS